MGTMGLRAHRGYLALVASIFVSITHPSALCQSRQTVPTFSKGVYPGGDEASAVLGAALESMRGSASADCSHLVHAIFERAGLPYSYLTSYDLYAGGASFLRVSRPRPGDLIVWPGHVGIVVSPRNHTFYSAFSTGPGVEDYDSKYWRGRGDRRFFRYTKNSPAREVSTHLTPTRAVNAETTQTDQLEAADPSPQSGGGPVSLSTDISSIYTPDPMVRSKHPTTNEIQEVVLRSFHQNAESLRGENLFALPGRVVFFDKFRVRKVHIGKNRSWIDIEIDELASVIAGQIEAKRRFERKHWSLTRGDGKHWEVELPRGTIYVARQAAPQILAHQLAALTDSSPDTKGVVEQSQLAHTLDVLLH